VTRRHIVDPRHLWTHTYGIKKNRLGGGFCPRQCGRRMLISDASRKARASRVKVPKVNRRKKWRVTVTVSTASCWPPRPSCSSPLSSGMGEGLVPSPAVGFFPFADRRCRFVAHHQFRRQFLSGTCAAVMRARENSPAQTQPRRSRSLPALPSQPDRWRHPTRLPPPLPQGSCVAQRSLETTQVTRCQGSVLIRQSIQRMRWAVELLPCSLKPVPTTI